MGQPRGHTAPGVLQPNFWPQGHNLNKHGKGLLDDDTYQISSSRPYGFRQEDF